MIIRLKSPKQKLNIHSIRIMRINCDSSVTETFDNNVFLKHLKNFNITINEQNIDEFSLYQCQVLQSSSAKMYWIRKTLSFQLK